MSENCKLCGTDGSRGVFSAQDLNISSKTSGGSETATTTSETAMDVATTTPTPASGSGQGETATTTSP